MPLPDDSAAESAKGSHRYVVLIRINTATPLRIATCSYLFITTADDDLDPSATYLGYGLLGGLGAFQQLVGGVAEQYSITLSGADAVPQSYVDDDDSDIIGSEVNLGIVFQDHEFQTVDKVGWLWTGTVGPVTSEFSDGAETVSLSCASEFVDRSRAAPLFWSSAGHRSRHPGDAMCDFTTALSEGITITWPVI